jgi:hypothetical protein
MWVKLDGKFSNGLFYKVNNNILQSISKLFIS